MPYQEVPQQRQNPAHSPENLDPQGESEQRTREIEEVLKRPDVRAAIKQRILQEHWVPLEEGGQQILKRLIQDPKSGERTYYVIRLSDQQVFRLDRSSLKYEGIPSEEYPGEAKEALKALEAGLQAAERESAPQAAPPEQWQLQWRKEQTYQWTVLKDGSKYAVYLSGRVCVWSPGTNRVQDVTDFEKLPQEVRQKLWRQGNGYRWIILENGDKYAVYPSGRVSAWSAAEGLRDVSIGACPLLVREEYARMTSGQAQRPREESRPAPTPERTEAEPEQSREQVPATPREIVERLRVLRFTDKDGNSLEYAAISTFSETYFHRHGIADARLPDYHRNMMEAEQRMREIVKINSLPGAKIVFDGTSFILADAGRNLTVKANALYLLKQTGTEQGTEYFTRIDAEGRGTQVRHNRMHPKALNHDVYEFRSAYGRKTEEFIGRDGSLKLRMETADGRVQNYQYFDGRGSGAKKRPNVLYVGTGALAVEMPTRDGAITRERHALGQGIHFVPETGRPIGKFQSRVPDHLKSTHRLDAEDKRKLEEYVDQVVSVLRTPEAITAFVAANFQPVHQDQNAGIVRQVEERAGQQDAQHPLRTIFLGTGDCEDYALLIQYLCGKASEKGPGNGCASFVAKTFENHYAAYFVEEYTQPDGRKGYALCRMHSWGFDREYKDGAKTLFSSPKEALNAVWMTARSNVDSGVEARIKDADASLASMSLTAPEYPALRRYAESLRRLGGRGVVVMDRVSANMNDGRAREMVIPSDDNERYWAQFVRKMS